MDTMTSLIQDLQAVRVANALDFTVEQVRTLNALEREHDAAYEAECRAAARLEPIYPGVERFQVEVDRRLGLPRVTFYDVARGFMTDAVVLADGRLDYRL